jgi:hypothetical protein
MSNAPIILLFGMPRSGTTWIGKIFDSHTRTLYRHEPDTWNKITQIPLLEDVSQAHKHCAFVNDYVDVSVNGKLPLFPKKYSSFLRHNLFSASVLLSGVVSRFNRNVQLPVFPTIDSDRADDYVVVWKSIQLLGRMGIMVNCLDDCKAIHILRHPCGYIASVMSGESKKKFMSYTPASEDYGIYELLMDTEQAQRHELSLDKLKTMTPEERLAWRWVLFNEKAGDDTRDNENVRILHYEDMCSDPVATAKSYFEFCDLEWCHQTAEFLGVSTTKDSESYYSVYKNPEKAAAKWKTVLSPEAINKIREVVEQSAIGSHYLDDF